MKFIFLICFLILANNIFSNETENKLSKYQKELNTILDLLLKSKDKKTALEHLSKFEVKISKSNEEALNSEELFLLGKAYFYATLDSKAITALNKSITLDQQNSRPLFYLGLIQTYAKNDKDAINYFKKALKISPDKTQYQRTLAKCYSRLGETKKALNTHLKILENNPNDTDSLLSSANIYANAKQNKEAEKAYLHYLKLKPKDMSTTYNLGLLYQFMSKHQLSLNCFASVVSKDKLSEQAHNFV